jgi:hypothetical protein
VNLLVAVVHAFAPHPAYVLGPRFDVVAAVGSHRSWATQGSLTSGLLTFSEDEVGRGVSLNLGNFGCQVSVG